MELVKYEHACFTVEKDDALLVVDPGNLTLSLGAPQNVIAIIITHQHADHFDPIAVDALLSNNPTARLYGPADVTEQLTKGAVAYTTVKPGDNLTVGPFELRFFGGQHAIIHDSIPTIDNVGVLIDQTLYYPGDCFTLPDQKVTALALPAAAPWMAIRQAIDFVTELQPDHVFPTHDAIYSAAGKAIADTLLSQAVAGYGGSYKRLEPQDTFRLE